MERREFVSRRLANSELSWLNDEQKYWWDPRIRLPNPRAAWNQEFHLDGNWNFSPKIVQIRRESSSLIFILSRFRDDELWRLIGYGVEVFRVESLTDFTFIGPKQRYKSWITFHHWSFDDGKSHRRKVASRIDCWAVEIRETHAITSHSIRSINVVTMSHCCAVFCWKEIRTMPSTTGKQRV